jgi:hypothetical protein
MRTHMHIAAAALVLAAPALAPVLADETCLPDANGAQCDVFLDEYRADDVTVGATDMWASDEFVMEKPLELSAEVPPDEPYGDDVIYWDGDSAMIVPEESGPRLEIADW